MRYLGKVIIAAAALAGSGPAVADIVLPSAYPTASPPSTDAYFDGSMPVIVGVDHTDYNMAYTGYYRDMVCADEVRKQYKGVKFTADGPWLKVALNDPLFIPETDEAPHPSRLWLHCSTKKIGFELHVGYLKGSAHPQIAAQVIETGPGDAGVAKCVEKATRLVAADRRFNRPPPLEKANIYDSVDFEDRSKGLGYVISCHHGGEALVAVFGKSGHDTELPKIVAAMQQP